MKSHEAAWVSYVERAHRSLLHYSRHQDYSSHTDCFFQGAYFSCSPGPPFHRQLEDPAAPLPHIYSNPQTRSLPGIRETVGMDLLQ